MNGICTKEFSDSNFNSAVIVKISIFKEIAQISHIHNNRNFLKVGGPIIDFFRITVSPLLIS